MQDSSKKKAILLIVPAFFETRPQSIRFRNIVRYFNPDKEIQIIVIFPGNKVKKYNFIENVNVLIYEYKGSKIGNFLNRHYYPDGNYKYSYFPQKARKYLRFLLRYFFLHPDPFVLEIGNLKRVINMVTLDFQVTDVVLSVAPHSVLKLSKFLWKKFKNEKVVVSLDVGDPFFNNSVKRTMILPSAYAKSFEQKYFKFIDKLIVTNHETKDHYLKTHPNLLSSKMMSVIPMGGVLRYNSSGEIVLRKKKRYGLVYTGIFYKKLRNPSNIFAAIEQFNNSHFESFQLDIYGAGMEYYESKLTESMKKYINFRGVIQNEAVYRLYENYDLILHIDNAFGLQTPGKNFELLLSGMPILFVSSNMDSSSSLLFKSFPGTYSSENNKDKLIECLEKILLGGVWDRSNEELINYTWESRANKFFEILEANR